MRRLKRALGNISIITQVTRITIVITSLLGFLSRDQRSCFLGLFFGVENMFKERVIWSKWNRKICETFKKQAHTPRGSSLGSPVFPLCQKLACGSTGGHDLE